MLSVTELIIVILLNMKKNLKEKLAYKQPSSFARTFRRNVSY